MMKQQIRMVRIFFFVAAALIVAAFYAGFYFGNSRSDSDSPVVENTTGLASGEKEDSATGARDDEDTVESMTTLSPDKYYLKQNGTYLSVYKGTSTAVYFDTDIRVEDLPETLQNLSGDGIAFDDLPSVYEFLENYSS